MQRVISESSANLLARELNTFVMNGWKIGPGSIYGISLNRNRDVGEYTEPHFEQYWIGVIEI
jgi:hypothetical protein